MTYIRLFFYKTIWLCFYLLIYLYDITVLFKSKFRLIARLQSHHLKLSVRKSTNKTENFPSKSSVTYQIQWNSTALEHFQTITKADNENVLSLQFRTAIPQCLCYDAISIWTNAFFMWVISPVLHNKHLLMSFQNAFMLCFGELILVVDEFLPEFPCWCSAKFMTTFWSDVMNSTTGVLNRRITNIWYQGSTRMEQ